MIDPQHSSVELRLKRGRTDDKTTSSDSPDSSMVKFLQSVGSAVGNEKLAEKGREQREEKTHGTDDGQDESSI